MTVRELIICLQDLGEENFDKEIVIFDGPSHNTPYVIRILDDKFGIDLKDKVLID